MASKKQKDKKKRIQQQQTARKTGSLEMMQANSLQQRLSKLDALHRSEHLELLALRSANQTLAKDVSELERKLKAREKLTADMHNNHVLMRQSLADIRTMHMPTTRYKPDGDPIEVCSTCGCMWPCNTYSVIAMPEQVAITGLLMIEQDLTKEE